MKGNLEKGCLSFYVCIRDSRPTGMASSDLNLFESNKNSGSDATFWLIINQKNFFIFFVKFFLKIFAKKIERHQKDFVFRKVFIIFVQKMNVIIN